MMTYKVWFKSMNLRYFIEAVVFVLLLLYFQYNFDGFIKDLHTLGCDHRNVKKLIDQRTLPWESVDIKECFDGLFDEFTGFSTEEALQATRVNISENITRMVSEL